MSETTCEVLRPTLEEFKDFRKFVEKVVDDKIGGIAGIIKIIPPDGWFTGKYDNIDQIKFRPVQQQVVNKESGAYTLGLQDVEEMSVETFKNYAVLNQASTDDHAQLERQFWRNLGKQTSYADGEMMYGADVQGTLFDGAHACGWNLSNLDSALRLIGCDIPGVSSSMLYIGMWSTMFPMHVEDCDLYSINYLHVGERKSWYCVPPKHRVRVENLARSIFPEEFHFCKEFLRHKTAVLSASTLRTNAIPFDTVVQEAGEFVITMPGSYHTGYNHGFNIAEATNFATPRWIDVGKKASKCQCNPDAVHVNMDLFETLYLRSQRLQGTSPYNTKVRRMRCACDKNAAFDSNKMAWVGPNTRIRMFECKACQLWCHLGCLYEDGYVPSTDERLLCHICFGLENHPPERTGSKKGVKGGKRAADDSDDDDDTDESSDEDEEEEEEEKEEEEKKKNGGGGNGKGSKSSGPGSSPVAKRAKINPSSLEATAAAARQSGTSTIRKKVCTGDQVMVGGTEYKVVDVTDGRARLHRRGTSKQEDEWVEIATGGITTVKQAPLSNRGSGGIVGSKRVPQVKTGRRKLPQGAAVSSKLSKKA